MIAIGYIGHGCRSRTEALARSPWVARVKQGLILFGHGARDPRWAEPFERLAARVRAQTQAEVRLAFLEFIAPDLDAAATALIAAGVTCDPHRAGLLWPGRARARDLPSRVAALRKQHPTVVFRPVAAIGEDAKVIEALADYCLRALEP